MNYEDISDDQILDSYSIILIPNKEKHYSPSWHDGEKILLKRMVLKRSSWKARPNFTKLIHAKFTLQYPNNYVSLEMCPFVNKRGDVDEELALKRKIASAKGEVTKTQNRIDYIIDHFSKTLFPKDYEKHPMYIREMRKLQDKQQILNELLLTN